MLIYHPAYDAYHCIFRMLALISCISDLEVEKARILDFYLLFPSAVTKIKLPQKLSYARQLGRDQANIYRDPINPNSTFRELAHIQSAALNCIAASGLIEKTKYESGTILRTNKEIPENLLTELKDFLSRQGETAVFILNELSTLPLKGANGLKDRTQLMEYRYDVI